MSGEGDEDAVRTAIDAARTWRCRLGMILELISTSVFARLRSLGCLAGSATGARARVPHASETGAWHATWTNISKEYSDPYYDFFCSTNDKRELPLVPTI